MVSAGQNPPAGRPPEKGERAADVPTFFKKKGLVPEFDQFLRRSGPGHFVEPTLLADVNQPCELCELIEGLTITRLCVC